MVHRNSAPAMFGRRLWDPVGVNLRRTVVLTTCLAVAGLLVWLALVKWSTASKVTSVVSALAAVAAVGVAVLAVLPGSAVTRRLQATRTGQAVAEGNSSATSGIKAKAGRSPEQVKASRTGDAKASGGGEATSGIRLD